MGVVAAVSIGCKVNQYELQALKRHYAGRPGRWALLLTCCVTGEAERKSRKALRRLLQRHPNATVVVAGCLVTLRPDMFKQERVVAVDNAAKAELLSRIRIVPNFEGRSRALLKVCDGCPSSCSYCIVCRVRGRLRSRKVDDILAEAESIAAAGFKEVVLVGVNLAAYGRDAHSSLADLLLRLSKERLFPRIRLSSLEPHFVDDALLEAIGECDSVCTHFHLPLQSGSDAVLSHMRRPYTAADFMRLVERLRKIRSKPAITTDIIVGYPTETDADFEKTLSLVEDVGFSRVHIFPYSARPNTPAAQLTPLPSRLVKERFNALKRVADAAAAAYRRGLLGLYESFIPEKDGLGMLERYVRARFLGTKPSGFERVVVVDVSDGEGVVSVAAQSAKSLHHRPYSSYALLNRRMGGEE